MTELTPAQRLRVAAAFSSGDTIAIRRDEFNRWIKLLEDADNALAALEASEQERQRQVQALAEWNFRVVTAMGLAQAVVFGWLL